MRNRVFVFVMLAAVLASMSSCNCGQNRPQKYVLTLEPLAKADEQPLLDVKTPVAIWDDSTILTSAYPTLEGDNFVLVPDDSTVLNGVVHMVYPANAFIVGEGCVAINTVQQLLPMGENMVYYGETTESEPNAVALKSVGGVLRLRLTTPEKLSKVEISTADSNRYMAGVFGVTNYPFPVLTATEQSVRCLELTGLESVDFAQSAEVCCCMAPGCYKTFTVVMTATDGRTCTKSLKEGKEVVLDRNRVCTVNLGSQEETLVFE